MAKKETLEFKRTIKAPAAEVFLALTNATALREWFCDVAQIEPRKGGRVYFAWHQGYYAAGEVTKVTTDKKLAFTWAGRGEPDVTQVEIRLTARRRGAPPSGSSTPVSAPGRNGKTRPNKSRTAGSGDSKTCSPFWKRAATSASRCARFWA